MEVCEYVKEKTKQNTVVLERPPNSAHVSITSRHLCLRSAIFNGSLAAHHPPLLSLHHWCNTCPAARSTVYASL